MHGSPLGILATAPRRANHRAVCRQQQPRRRGGLLDEGERERDGVLDYRLCRFELDRDTSGGVLVCRCEWAPGNAGYPGSTVCSAQRTVEPGRRDAGERDGLEVRWT